MNCVEPFVKAGEVYPCGRCLPCKFRARRIWFHRVLLEASQHDYNSVCTLTYDQASLPQDGELHPEHLRNWLKRYRKRSLERYPWRRLRFIACGEYGEESARPHFHLVLFGQPSCGVGRTGRQWCEDCSCISCTDVSETWGLGATSLQSMDRASAAYICGYVTRKVMLSDNSHRIKPFMRMSNRPGIGAGAMWDVASTMMQYRLEEKGVPTLLRHGSSPMVLGRFLRTKLAERVGCEVSPIILEEVRMVCDYAFATSRSVRSVFRQINESYDSVLRAKEVIRERKGL